MKTVLNQVFNFRILFSDTFKWFVLCLSLLVSNVAFAQSDLSPKGRIDIQNGKSEDLLNSKKDLIFKNSGPLRDVIAGNPYISGDKVCEVEISISYFQAGSRANVEAEIDHSQCGASNGKYTVSLKTQDTAGVISTKKYQEVWSRTDADAVTVKHAYQMSDNTELLKARIKLPSKDFCTCIDSD